MCFIFSLIPATIFTVIGYFVLFSSTKTEGAVQKFGQVLAIWVFIVALFFPNGFVCDTFGSMPNRRIDSNSASWVNP
jgi:hypothetical protein